MSNLIESYSLATGLKIDKPFLYSVYFPIPFENYITLQNSSGMDSKNYDYWQEVINLISPYLKEKDIKVLQLGDSKTPTLKGCHNLGGQTSIHQANYIVSKSKLHLGNDSWLVHLASSLDCPCIALYGPTRPSNHGPYFGHQNNNILFESHRNGAKPSFSAQENPKTINYIKPEDVANAVLEKLGILEKINIETLYIGSNYHEHLIDIVMDNVVSPDFIKGGIFNARMDYYFDEENLIKNLSLRKYQITTNKPIKADILKIYKPNIANIVYEINENYNLKFVDEISKSSIPYILITKLEDDILNPIKLEFLDYNPIYKIPKISKESLENHEKMTISTSYKTNKFLLGRNKVFLNKMDWESDNPIRSFDDNIGKINLENPDFFNDYKYFYIFNQN